MLVLGVVGSISSSVALLAVWLRMRPMLIPLILFLIFTMVLDAASIFMFYTTLSEQWSQRLAFIPRYSHDLVLFIIGKLIYSILLFHSTCQSYRRNLKLRGGRSPFRIQKKNSETTGDQENQKHSASPKLSKKQAKFQYSQFGQVQELWYIIEILSIDICILNYEWYDILNLL